MFRLICSMPHALYIILRNSYLREQPGFTPFTSIYLIMALMFITLSLFAMAAVLKLKSYMLDHNRLCTVASVGFAFLQFLLHWEF